MRAALNAALAMTATQRHVYLDLGTNWGDTLDLYRKGLADGAHANATNWEIYGFEAAAALRRFLVASCAFLGAL